MKANQGKFSPGDGELSAYPNLLQSLLAGQEFMPLISSPERARHRAEWRDLLRTLTLLPPSSPALSEAFHTQWHVCHHRLRELVDDDDLMLDAAWSWLPRYAGPDLDLYRGENIDRFDAGQIGCAWSDSRETAEMFARGLNAVSKGGILLRATIPAEAIIAGPSTHSAYLGESEFTVDSRRLGPIATIVRFMPSY